MVRHHRVRILVRQQNTGLYLQESGEWSGSRETAWNFESPRLAYRWAKERERLRLEVLLVIFDPQYEHVVMRT